jgi:hypothetical protein
MLNQIGFFLFFQIQSIKNNWYWELNKISSHEGLEEVLLELPVVFPYAYYQNDFESANTSVQIEDEFYRITKHKYSNDTIFLVFVKDSTKNKINSIVQGWIESDDENKVPSNSNQRTPLFKMVEENYIDSFSITTEIVSFNYNSKSQFFGVKQIIPQSLPGTVSPPPEYFLS